MNFLTNLQEKETSYDSLKCNYSYIQTNHESTPWSEKCDLIANGFCKTKNHFINPYKVYYCMLGKSESNNLIFILLSAFSLIVLFLSMNHIRRRYFVRPLLKLRALLDLSGPMAEITILPLMEGISPMLVRLQGASHNLEFSFNIAGSLGAIFNLLAFSVGICALVIGFSPQVNHGNLIINLLFILVSVALYYMIFYNETVSAFEGGIFVFLWIVYLCIRKLMVPGSKRGKL